MRREDDQTASNQLPEDSLRLRMRRGQLARSDRDLDKPNREADEPDELFASLESENEDEPTAG